MEKLYRVTLQGLGGSATSKSISGAYVVAFDANEAYNKVREYLDKDNYGFVYERELKSIELVAEPTRYGCQQLDMLFI